MLCNNTGLKRRKLCRRNVIAPRTSLPDAENQIFCSAKGRAVADTIKYLGVSIVTCYLSLAEGIWWYDDPVKRLKEFEKTFEAS